MQTSYTHFTVTQLKTYTYNGTACFHVSREIRDAIFYLLERSHPLYAGIGLSAMNTRPCGKVHVRGLGTLWHANLLKYGYKYTFPQFLIASN